MSSQYFGDQLLKKAARYFRRDLVLPVDLYMELRDRGYDPDELESQYWRKEEDEDECR
jgi:hypothetical protein